MNHNLPASGHDSSRALLAYHLSAEPQDRVEHMLVTIAASMPNWDAIEWYRDSSVAITNTVKFHPTFLVTHRGKSAAIVVDEKVGIDTTPAGLEFVRWIAPAETDDPAELRERIRGIVDRLAVAAST